MFAQPLKAGLVNVPPGQKKIAQDFNPGDRGMRFLIRNNIHSIKHTLNQRESAFHLCH